MSEERTPAQMDAAERLATNVEHMRRFSLRLRQGAQRMVALPALCREVASELDRLAYDTELVMEKKEARDGGQEG